MESDPVRRAPSILRTPHINLLIIYQEREKKIEFPFLKKGREKL